jgi:thiol-disulfide isomerase/thioredoxin
MHRAVRPAVAIALGAVLLSGCAAGSGEEEAASSPSPVTSATPTPAPAPEPEPAAPAAAPGGYIDLATYQADPAAFAANDVVLFFNASWCPTCKAATANLTTEAFPAGLTVVSVDYDGETDLRRQYGVTVQHTFVQVDPAGTQLAKWSGSTTVDQIAGQVV